MNRSKNSTLLKLNEEICLQNAKPHDFDLDNLIFEERVKLLCKHCARYNKSWTCPPKINDINYEKMFKEYDSGLVVEVTMTCSNPEEYQLIRRKSTNSLHRLLLKLEKVLWDNQSVMGISFIGGSCKFCDECPPEGCRLPYLSRIPWEGTGVNVIKSLKKGCGIEVVYDDHHISRYGLIVW